jgi:hypothetical protein
LIEVACSRFIFRLVWSVDMMPCIKNVIYSTSLLVVKRAGIIIYEI